MTSRLIITRGAAYPLDECSGTGYDVVLWLEANPQFWPKGGVRCHSMNPVGKQRMEVAIHRHYLAAPTPSAQEAKP